MDHSSRQQKDMSLKVVLGSIEKNQVDQKVARDTAALQNTKQISPQAAAAQQSVARAVQNTDAVISTLRAFKATSLGNAEPIKDIRQAEKLAGEIAEKIRADKDGEASSAHDGLSSDMSAPKLAN
jgi:hypothetical protein